MTGKDVIPVCRACKSSDIFCTGDANWDADEQAWNFHPGQGVDQMCWCQRCEATNDYVWRTRYEIDKEIIKDGI